jgi:ureidoglycolate hydrolase
MLIVFKLMEVKDSSTLKINSISQHTITIYHHIWHHFLIVLLTKKTFLKVWLVMVLVVSNNLLLKIRFKVVNSNIIKLSILKLA